MKHLRSIGEVGVDGVLRLLDLTDTMAEVNRRPNPKVPALRGKTVCNLFFEDSTRTRLSFETAAKRLSADVMTFSGGTSSVNQGESLRDTIETVAAMGVDAVVIRHKASGVRGQVSRAQSGCEQQGQQAHTPYFIGPTEECLLPVESPKRAGGYGPPGSIVSGFEHDPIDRLTVNRSAVR